MPDSSQLVALLQLLLVQQKEILHIKSHLFAMEQVIFENLGEEPAMRFHQEAERIERSDLFGGTRAAIAAVEELLQEFREPGAPN